MTCLNGSTYHSYTSYSRTPHPPRISYDYENYYNNDPYEYDSFTGCPGTITLYSKTYFRGKSFQTDIAVNDLANYDFDDKVQSIEVIGCSCWKVYENPNFIGNFIFLEPNEYKSAVDIKNIFKKASSMYRIPC